MTAADVAALVVVGGTATGVVLTLATWHRREVVPPVPRRAMRQLLERLTPNEEEGTP